jgi:hypothetical protein
MGFDVSIPLTESAPYDLIVDDGTSLYRVQCKFSSTPDVDLRRIHSNGTGYVMKRVAPHAYDWLCVASVGSAVLVEALLCRSSVSDAATASSTGS